MSLLDDCRAALASANVQAFLRVIRAGESSQGDDAYRMMFGGGLFDGFVDHPRQAITRGTLTSTAAGAYQFLARTWDECRAALELPDFSPQSQDLAAVFLIKRRGALADAIAGRIQAAIGKCAREWASLPGSPYGQPTRSMAQALATFARYGGVAAPDPRQTGDRPPAEASPPPATPAAPGAAQPERPMPSILDTVVTGIGLVNPFAGLIAAMFKPIVQDKLTTELQRHTDKPEVKAAIEQTMMSAAQAATGETEPLQVAAALQKQPELVQQVEQSVMDHLDALKPVLDGIHQRQVDAWATERADQDAAAVRARGDAFDMTPALMRSAIGALFALIGLVGFIVVYQVIQTQDHTADTAAWAALTGLIGFVTGAMVSSIYSYRFATTRNSSANQAVMAELARRPTSQ